MSVETMTRGRVGASAGGELRQRDHSRQRQHNVAEVLREALFHGSEGYGVY